MKTYILLTLVVCKVCAVVQANNMGKSSINHRQFGRAPPIYSEVLRMKMFKTKEFIEFHV